MPRPAGHWYGPSRAYLCRAHFSPAKTPVTAAISELPIGVATSRAPRAAITRDHRRSIRRERAAILLFSSLYRTCPPEGRKKIPRSDSQNHAAALALLERQLQVLLMEFVKFLSHLLEAPLYHRIRAV